MQNTVDKLKGAKIYVKPVNYACGIACIAMGVFYGIIVITASVPTIYSYLAPLYFAAFGVIMISADLGIQVLVENCNFLDIYAGRGLFNIFVGSQIVNQAAITLGNTSFEPLFKTTGTITGYVLMVLGVYLIVLHCLEKNNSMSGLVGGGVQSSVAKAVITSKLGV